MTIQKAMESEQISKIKKEYGETFTIIAITRILKEACMFVSNDLSAEVLMTYSELLISDYWMLRIDDFILAVKRGIKGQYGKIYGSLDYPKITGWLDAYREEKDNFVDNKNYQNHVSALGSNNHERSSEKNEAFEAIVKKELIKHTPKQK